MKVNNKKYIISLIGVLFVGLFFIWKKNSDNATLDEVSLKKIEQENGMFAIMLQSATGSEEYTQSTEETWPTAGYEFNSTKSGCLDSDGKKIDDVEISYDANTNKIRAEVDSSSYCYIYFDIEATREGLAKICKDIDMNNCVTNKSNELNGIESLNNGNKGDLAYRYVGTQEDIVNNYVCFGDESCSSGITDNHMYRIIGITSNGNIKIQKNSSIGTYQWNDKYTSSECSNEQCTWDKSTMYTSTLNSFYENEIYVSRNMKDKIEKHTWNTGDVQTLDLPTGNTVYNLEQQTQTQTHTGEIGLAYLSDYYFAYDESGNTNCYSGYCESWMMPKVTEYSTLWSNTTYEWTMTRYGQYSDDDYDVWYVYYKGTVRRANPPSLSAVRPVFYLTSDVTITKGSGTSTSPYILK